MPFPPAAWSEPECIRLSPEVHDPRAPDIIALVKRSLRSTFVTSQLPVSKWHDVVADPSVADALLDRLIGSATWIEMKGGSLRKPEGTTPSE